MLRYNGPTFETTEQLASHLDSTVDELEMIASNLPLDSAMRRKETKKKWRKKSKAKSRVFTVAPDISQQVQERILHRILECVSLPPYLHGSIPGRDRETNAKSHGDSYVLISTDIKDFFPTTTGGKVRHLFATFFGFSAPVAQLLTRLVTHRGKLPQGFATSSAIANLILFDVEPSLVGSIEKKGYRYTRLIDDISISSTKHQSDVVSATILEEVRACFKAAGYSLHEGKTSISKRDQPQVVNNLNINSGRPTYRKEDRRRIRAAVYQLERMYVTASGTSDYASMYHSAEGRVADLARYSAGIAKTFDERLRLIPPSS